MLTESIPTRRAPPSTSQRGPGFCQIRGVGGVLGGAPVPVSTSMQKHCASGDLVGGERAGAYLAVARVPSVRTTTAGRLARAFSGKPARSGPFAYRWYGLSR